MFSATKFLFNSSRQVRARPSLSTKQFNRFNSFSQRTFSSGGKGQGDGDGDGQYVSDDEDYDKFESDRRFSNFVLFGGALSLAMIFMASSVMQQQRASKNNQEKKQKELAAQSTSYTGKANIGGNWMLYNTKGEPVTHKQFEGKYYLIYFGFTYCPDVCPISLIKMAKTVNKVRESKEYNFFDLEAIFVSVDPDRDSNKRIDEYTKIFHPDLVGLTHKSNDHKELKDLLKKFKIHVSKIFLSEEEEKEDMDTLKENSPEVAAMMLAQAKEDEGKEAYTLDHSIVVYLIGPDNQFLTYLGSNLDEAAMTDIVLDEISADLKRKVIKN